MNEVEVKVTLETTIERYWVAIDDTDVVEPPRLTGTINVTVDKEHYLAWWFAGDPGASYKITLKPPTGFKVIAIGAQPVDRKIALDRLQSSDTLRFFVEAG